MAGCGPESEATPTAAVAGSESSAAVEASRAPEPNAGSGQEVIRSRSVVLISVDTLRADRLGSFGYERETSLNLDGLARRSVVFDQAIAQAPQTAPSHASLFTSQYAGTHGVVNVHGDQKVAHRLPGGLSTLASVLARHGLATAAFVCGGNLTRRMGMDRGFSVWDERNEDVGERVKAFEAWLDSAGEQPFFALLHTYQVHAPYVPPAVLAEQFTDATYAGLLRERYSRYLGLTNEEAWAGGVGPDYWDGMVDFTDRDVKFLSDLYDGEIAYTDGALRSVIRKILTGPLAATTTIVVLGDHGEEFRDHGKFQHDQVFQELVRVPLMIHLPVPLERAGWTGRVGEPVELIDVAPTIADLVGVDWTAESWQGKSLLGVLDPARRPRESDPDRPSFGELTVAPGPKTYRFVIRAGWKYIHCHQVDLDKTWEWLFDLRSDPREQANLLDSTEPEALAVLASLKELLEARSKLNEALRSQAGKASDGDIDAAWRQELEQLGYTGTAEAPRR